MRVVMTPDDFLNRSVLQCESASRSRKEAKTVIRIRSPDACRPAQRPRLFSSKPGLSLPPILFLVSLTTTSTHVRSPPALPSPGIHRANRQRNPAHRLLCSDSVTDIPTDRPHKSPPPTHHPHYSLPSCRIASPPNSNRTSNSRVYTHTLRAYPVHPVESSTSIPKAPSSIRFPLLRASFSSRRAQALFRHPKGYEIPIRARSRGASVVWWLPQFFFLRSVPAAFVNGEIPSPSPLLAPAGVRFYVLSRFVPLS